MKNLPDEELGDRTSPRNGAGIEANRGWMSEEFASFLVFRVVEQVPRAGIEPARPKGRGILSPLRLPIPPPRPSHASVLSHVEGEVV